MYRFKKQFEAVEETAVTLIKITTLAEHGTIGPYALATALRDAATVLQESAHEITRITQEPDPTS